MPTTSSASSPVTRSKALTGLRGDLWPALELSEARPSFEEVERGDTPPIDEGSSAVANGFSGNRPEEGNGIDEGAVASVVSSSKSSASS
jgi:hypothetical protein